MIGMRKGLFGKGMPGATMTGFGGGVFNMDGTPASMPQDATMQDGANLGTPAAAPQKSGFFGKGGVGRGIAGSIGDALLQQSGMAPIYAPQMQFQQVQAARQAEAQRARAAGLADYEAKKGIDARFATTEGPKPGSFEWYQNASTEDRALYDQYNPFVVSTGQGPVAVPRRPAVGTKISMAELGGGQAPTIQNTPAPQLGANGMPTTLTRAQYQAVVAARGQAETDAWARRNNIQVSN